MAKLKLVATGRWLTLVCASLGMLVSLPGAANAQSVLTWARVELIRNQVQLVTGGRSRRAQVSDVLGVNDALSTARRARAELRFNDGSLARIGESAVFRFTPDTRNFRLSNGTVLLLIPPGQGRTTIQTPNAVTGIRGSALFVRFIPETNTTIIGALTTNPGGPMMAFNEDGTAQQSLNAGEMAVVRGDGTIEHYEFELKQFYLTSNLVLGLYLDDASVSLDDAPIDAVREETLDALAQQEDFDDTEDIQENPVFLSSRAAVSSTLNTHIPEFDSSPAAAFLSQSGPAEGFAGVVSGAVNHSPGPPLGQQPTQPVSPSEPVKPTAPTPLPIEPEKPAAPIPEAAIDTVAEINTTGQETIVEIAPNSTNNEIISDPGVGLDLEKPEPPAPTFSQEATSFPPEPDAQLERLPDAIAQEGTGPETTGDQGIVGETDFPNEVVENPTNETGDLPD